MATGDERARRRLDVVLVASGVLATRARARDLIRRGLVLVDGARVSKPGAAVAPGALIALDPVARPDVVSRGAEKLAPALQAFGFECAGRTALDIGASTGGFTQILLEHGAARVYAVDVGHGQLDPQLEADQRVVSLEGQDARTLHAGMIREPIGALVADVSFISLAKALPAALTLTRPGAFAVLLVKPQFELGPGGVGRSGIVRDRAARTAAVSAVRDWLERQPGWRVIGTMQSPVPGGSGNIEVLLGAVRDA